ncbi:hypothetical protein TCAL_12664 [Tigriopus californicus]|uniref:Major facilitator superfamily (MFS) profile domain-containing protein n=1 Tax=Tigriopus californicus TaxID=6832 RepID=A0A553P2Q5_TIGCA|nr:hypothetical protein TCAL_12664 [Tigriopus californicus]|eukprot:TCALIF_12664-PA protein Name:"Similar to Slc18b1 MFS-type transporter SLC18B1 (Mus musculus)" AED:0.11 eAED:0.23 QI:833/0.75/0.8/1/1/1/5/0/479
MSESSDEEQLLLPSSSSASNPITSTNANEIVEPNNNEVEIKTARSCCSGQWQTWINLSILALTELLGGFTFSLLAPFYTNEATGKGLSVTETGLVYGSVFITSIIFAPIFGKYIEKIGSRKLFLYGTFVAGAANTIFGFLQWVDNRVPFLALSLLIRIISAIGEAAFFSAVYPIAAQEAEPENRSKVLSIMETMFALGLMIGPFVGGVLYEFGDFYLPFVSCGGSLMLCSIFGWMLLKTEAESETEGDQESVESTSFRQLLKMPTVLYCCLIVVISGLGSSWYLPSLQPYVESQFQLNSIAIGTLFMTDGATYAIFTPLWAWLLDKGMPPFYVLFFGNLFTLCGFLLLGPAPFLDFLPVNEYLLGFALALHGVDIGGAPDTEQTRGMITSLWFMNECLGDYIGSLGGGFAFDSMGFVNSTVIVIGIQLVILVSLPILGKVIRTTQTRTKNEETAPLLRGRSVDGICERPQRTYCSIRVV